ncbi:hypothetical protein EJB05_13937, partial [Eragrostis curvula]
MEQSSGDGGDLAAKRPDLSPSGAGAGEDRLSALPEDILVLILLRLDTITEAARTSVLSRRGRRTWALLPELTFHSAPDHRHIREVLEATKAPALREILVFTKDDAPDSVAAWLPLAARRLSGTLLYHNHNTVEEYGYEEDDETEAAIPLPCFRNATAIDLDLGFMPLCCPSSGAFTRLTELCLERVRFQGTCELGDVVSWPRCPGLRKLRIRHAWGVARLTVRSESLLQMDLLRVNGLQQLNVDAPLLNLFLLRHCLTRDQPQPIANISAPLLITLVWMDVYDSSYVHLGNLGQLQQLGPNVIVVYGNHHSGHNREVLRFLQHFQIIHKLKIVLGYPQGDIGNFQYLMEDITRLPHVTFLTLLVMNEGHAFGASSFHVLRLCTGIRKLSLVLLPSCNSETQSTCPSGCICDESANWKIENLSLNCLREVEITDLSGAECEVAFLKQLFKWAGVLEKLRITFDYSVSKSKVKEVCQRLSSISRPETLIEFCMYRNSGRGSMDFLSLKDEGTGIHESQRKFRLSIKEFAA